MSQPGQLRTHELLQGLLVIDEQNPQAVMRRRSQDAPPSSICISQFAVRNLEFAIVPQPVLRPFCTLNLASMANCKMQIAQAARPWISSFIASAGCNGKRTVKVLPWP